MGHIAYELEPLPLFAAVYQVFQILILNKSMGYPSLLK